MTPKITISGKEYIAKPPRAKLWRNIIKFNKTFSKTNIAESDEAFDAMLKMICDAFGHDEITPKVLEEELLLSEVMPTFQEVTTWVGYMVQGKADEMPAGGEKNE